MGCYCWREAVDLFQIWNWKPVVRNREGWRWKIDRPWPENSRRRRMRRRRRRIGRRRRKEEEANKMQQLDVYYQHFLNMFRAPLCPSSGEQDVCYCTWCAAL